MNAMPYLDVICRRMVDSYRKAYGDDIEAIFLYGSYARGDFNEASDLDFVAIVKGERTDLQNKCHAVWNDSGKIDLEYDVVSTPTVIPSSEFAKYKDSLPYYRNIAREGHRID